MRRVAALTLGFLTLLPIGALPQQAPTTGSIEGTVIRADTGDPIANAQVTLTGGPAPAGPGANGTNLPPGAATRTAGGGVSSGPTAVQLTPAAVANVAPPLLPGQRSSVTTGVDGKFVFKDLAAGTYRVAATANGFVRQEHGQRALHGQGRPLYVAPGQPIRDVAIKLPATGAISGRVFDENGHPATGAPIQLLRPVYNVNGRTYQAAGQGVADDRGDYRIYGVTPGRYYLLAGTSPGPTRPIAMGGAPAGSARFSMQFYPNATDVDQATIVVVESGAAASFDMRLKRETQTFHIRGRIVDPPGTPLPQNANIMLAYRSLVGSGGGTFTVGRSIDFATGTFDLPNVSPGDYTVQIQLPIQNPTPLTPGVGGIPNAMTSFAQQSEQLAQLAAFAPVRVTNADIDGVVLALTAGVTTLGKLLVEGQPISVVPNLDRLRLSIAPAAQAGGLRAPVAGPLAADGTFQVVGLREGDYRVHLSVPGFHLKSIKYGGEEILGKTFKFGGSALGTFEITIRAGEATVIGTVTDAKSQPVAGVPVSFVPAQRGRLDLFRTGITDQNGKFSIASLAPGEYKVFSWEAADNNAFFDPEFLKQYEQQGKLVVVAESSNPSVDLRLIPAQ